MNTELQTKIQENVNQNIFYLWNSEIEILLEKFLNTKKSKNTKTSYSTDLIQFFKLSDIFLVRDFIEKTKDWSISDYIFNYLEFNKKVDIKNINRVLNPSTLNRKLFALSSFYVYLDKIYNFKFNPTKTFTAYPTKKHSETNSLTLEEVQWFLDLVKSKYIFVDKNEDKIRWLRNYILFLLLSYSLRRSEIVWLKWFNLKENINWDYYFSVHQKWDTYKNIPINNSLKKYLDKLKKEKYLFWLRGDFIFTPLSNTRNWDLNKPISSNMVYYLVEKCWEELCYANPSLNDDFRHYQVKIDWHTLEKKRLQKRLLRLKKSEKHSDTEGCIADYNSVIEKINKDILQIKEEMKFHEWDLKKITPHSFRKSFIEIMIKKNENFINIINATWHNNVEMINYYQNIDKLKNNSINNIELKI